MIENLKAKETTFNIKSKGASGRLYEGTFTYKIPNNKATIEIKKMKSRLSEGLNLDPDTDFMLEIFSKLRVGLQKPPEWWVESDYGYELDDMEPVLEIFKQCRKFEDEYSNEFWEEKSEPEKQDEKVRTE